jgi:hypothetical protein
MRLSAHGGVADRLKMLTFYELSALFRWPVSLFAPMKKSGIFQFTTRQRAQQNNALNWLNRQTPKGDPHF